MNRAQDLERLYALLGELRTRVGGYRYLQACHARMGWPPRGVYFFFEPGEYRADGRTLRVVRVGTHAVSSGSRTTLWDRLAQHKGRTAGAHAGGGNHRGSIFRLHVGTALLARSQGYPPAVLRSWGQGQSAAGEMREAEHVLERDVSASIGAMPFLWLTVPDAPGTGSDRKVIEANTIALLSNRGKPPVDPPSLGWLGRYADRILVRESGLWNVNHVDVAYDPGYLDLLGTYINQMKTR